MFGEMARRDNRTNWNSSSKLLRLEDWKVFSISLYRLSDVPHVCFSCLIEKLSQAYLPCFMLFAYLQVYYTSVKPLLPKGQKLLRRMYRKALQILSNSMKVQALYSGQHTQTVLGVSMCQLYIYAYMCMQREREDRDGDGDLSYSNTWFSKMNIQAA